MTDQRTNSALWSLLLGNFVIGTGVLLPAGLLNQLSTELHVDVTTAGLLLFASGIVVGFGAPVFNGLKNFQTLFQDKVFFKALGNNLIWTLLFLTVPVLMGLTGAYLMSGIKRGQIFYRLVFFIPYVISSVVNTQN